MSVSPTLRCACRQAAFEAAFEYVVPPQGETAFDFGQQVYRRRYDRCLTCGHWFGRHELDLGSLYAHDYVASTYGGREGMLRRFERIMALPAASSDNQGRVQCILEFARGRRRIGEGPPRLLDVGAGLGVFPAAMKRAGWRVTALEPDSATVAHLREIVGVEALAADLATLSVDACGKFDAITFNKVLEHVEDPIAMLAHAHTLLEEAGFIYLEVPDVAAAVDGPGREEFFVEHHHVFSPTSVAQMAERSGLSLTILERLREPSGKYTLRAFVRHP